MSKISRKKLIEKYHKRFANGEQNLVLNLKSRTIFMKLKKYTEMRKKMNKQIEEMARVLVNRVIDKTWRPEKVAKELYKIAVPEDSIVLTKEEYEWLSCCFSKFEETMNDIKKLERKETAREIIAFIETLKVEEDGRHEWRDRHNDAIDRVILKLNQKFINCVEIKE